MQTVQHQIAIISGGTACLTVAARLTKERLSRHLLKRYGLPFLYWHGMLRGRA